jgi:hypothetical protein
MKANVRKPCLNSRAPKKAGRTAPSKAALRAQETTEAFLSLQEPIRFCIDAFTRPPRYPPSTRTRILYVSKAREIFKAGTWADGDIRRGTDAQQQQRASGRGPPSAALKVNGGWRQRRATGRRGRGEGPCQCAIMWRVCGSLE